MTDKEWENLAWKSGKDRGHPVTNCMHPDGANCTAIQIDGSCMALHNTIFKGKRCPFFRDCREMTIEQKQQYIQHLQDLRRGRG